MEIKTYRKELFYSYTLGAFPTIELIQNHPQEVLKVFVHSSFKNEEVIRKIQNSPLHCEVIVNDRIIQKLSQKENCYVMAVFKKYGMQLDENDNHLLLAQPMNMGNCGTIVRSALGFGYRNIAIIRPAIDIYDPKVLRAAMGAFFSCNIVYFDSIEDYKKKYPTHRLYSFMLQAKKTLQEAKFDFSTPVSLVFGNESSGLPESYLNEDSVIIRHSNKIDSLNLPTAVGIALYEASKQKDCR